MNSGGLVYQWMIDNFYSETSEKNDDLISVVINKIERIQPGSNGLIFLPYIFGERAPIWNEKARGVFFGIHEKHTRDHFARATFEGIIFALYSIYEIISSDIEQEIEIRATGGYTRSEELLQIQSDVFATPVNVPENHEGSSIGAAILAFYSEGVFDSLEQAAKHIRNHKKINPINDNSVIYLEASKKFIGL